MANNDQSETIDWAEEFAFTNQKPNDGNSLNQPTFYSDLLADPHFAQFAPGRTESIYQMMQILMRQKKPNVIILGEAGVGKTALIQGLAYYFKTKKIISQLYQHRLLQLDLNQLKSGAANAGTIEQKLIELEQMIKSSSEPIIFFIDEIHQLMNGSIHNQAIINFLKPHLTTNFIRIVGATTNSEYQKYFLKDRAMVRRFQTIVLNEIDHHSCLQVLKTIIKNQYPKQVQISDQDLLYLIKTSARYLPNRQLPDSAIDVFDQAFALRKLSDQPLEKFYLQDEIDYLKTTNQVQLVNEKMQQLDQYITIESEIEKHNARTIILKTQIQDLVKKQPNLDQSQLVLNQNQLKELTYQLLETNQELTKLTKKAQAEQNLQNENPLIIDRDVINNVIKTITGIEISNQNENRKQFQRHLEQQIVGQDDVLIEIKQQLLPYFYDLHQPNKPIASFLFTGSTGIGKTECAKAIAKGLFNEADKFLKIDMSEFKEAHSISKLIGTGAGYVGYGEQNQLASFVMSRPHSVILFDEIDKAHPNVLNLLLQILDEGILTDGQNNKINFKNTIIIMCANWCHDQSQQNSDLKTIKDQLIKIIKPEVVNRIDRIINFKTLDQNALVAISKMHCAKWQDRIANRYQLQLNFDESAHQWFANRGYDQRFGARFLKQIIDQEIMNLVAPVLETVAKSGNELAKVIKITNLNQALVIA